MFIIIFMVVCYIPDVVSVGILDGISVDTPGGIPVYVSVDNTGGVL